MFTGVIEHIGVVRRVRPLEVEAPKAARHSKVGGSVSVNGVCLTVVKKAKRTLSFNIIRETKRRSTLGALKPGDKLHLELPLRHGGRLEGHFVLGHVDGVGKVSRVVQKGREKSLLIQFPAKLKKYFIEKGSVALDGVSLTLGKVTPSGFWVHLIPHTLKHTRFNSYAPGTLVNLEADLLVKLFRG